MNTVSLAETGKLSNPIDIVEDVALARDWVFERECDDEMSLVVATGVSDLHISFNWRDDIEGLHMACAFDIKTPRARREPVRRLTALINEQLFFGHFDLWSGDGSLLFRNGLNLSGGATAGRAQIDSMIMLALDACERFYPAFQYVIWAGATPEQALQACLMETAGEA